MQMTRGMQYNLMLIRPAKLPSRARIRKPLLQGGHPSGLQIGVRVMTNISWSGPGTRV